MVESEEAIAERERRWSTTRRVWKRLEPWLILAVFAVAAFLLYQELKSYRWDEVVAALQDVARRRIWQCIGLTVVSYIVLIGYDLLAVRAIGHPLPLRRVALASFTGFAFSYNFGSVLAGTPVRYRLYSAWSLTRSEIVRLFVMMAVTFWVGVIALAGVVFIVWPFPLPVDVALPFGSVQPLGFLLSLIAIGYLLVAVFVRKGIIVRGRRLHFPSPALTATQLLVAAADLLVAAGCLYVLVADDIPLSFTEFLGVYLLAVVVVIVTHVPGGAGVFELLVLKFCEAQSPETLLAALLVFRVVYYLIPLLLASGLLVGHEWQLRRSRMRNTRDG